MSALRYVKRGVLLRGECGVTKMSEEAVERGKKRRLCDVLMWSNNGMRMTYAGVLLRGVARESQRCAAA